MITPNTDGQFYASRPTPVYMEDLATSATLTIMAADANKHFQVYGYTISSDTAGDYLIKSGTTTLAAFQFGANSGVHVLWAPLYLTTGTKNEALTLTKPAGAKTRVTAFIGAV